ncbi:MAG: hypothetical protein ACE5JL_09155 [Dehalococcoidia bacterium]
MAVSRKRAQDYAEKVLERPRGEMSVTLRRGKGGVTLLYGGRAVTKCHASRVGDLQAAYMARALGVELPSQGGKVSTKVPSGVLYRAIGISALDLRRPEALKVMAQLLATAEMQRTVFGGAVA